MASRFMFFASLLMNRNAASRLDRTSSNCFGDVVQLFQCCLVVRSISGSDDSRRRRPVDVTTSRLNTVELFRRRDQHQHPADRGTATPHTRRGSVAHPLYGQVATNDGPFTPRAHPRESAPLTARHRSRCKRPLTMRTADTLANPTFTEPAARTDPGRKRYSIPSVGPGADPDVQADPGRGLG